MANPSRLMATQLAGKNEGTEGNKEALALADAILVKDCTFDPKIEMYDRDLLRGTFSRDPSLSGKRSGIINFTVELCGQGNKGSAPPWGKFMKGCGYNETISANNSVTYTSNNASLPFTISAYQDGVIKTIWGARGNVKFSFESGKPGLAMFSFEGADWDMVDGALLAANYSAVVPPTFLAAGLTWDSYAAIMSKVEIDTGNILAKRESINAASGFLSTMITGRNPKGSMDPELMTVASYNAYGKWKVPGTLGSLTFSANGGNGNIITVTCPKVRILGISDQDRTGLRTMGVDFQPCINAGDDEIQIVLT